MTINPSYRCHLPRTAITRCQHTGLISAICTCPVPTDKNTWPLLPRISPIMTDKFLSFHKHTLTHTTLWSSTNGDIRDIRQVQRAACLINSRIYLSSWRRRTGHWLKGQLRLESGNNKTSPPHLANFPMFVVHRSHSRPTITRRLRLHVVPS